MKLPLSPFVVFVASILFVLFGRAAAADDTVPVFGKQQMERYYWSEGANFGDLDRDGKPDAIYGPFWWKGPEFTQRHEIYPAQQTFKAQQPGGGEKTLPGFEGGYGNKNAYSQDNFFAFVHDFNGDGWNDLLTYGLPGTPGFIYLNPARRSQHWERHTILDTVDNESPTFTDLTGDGKPEIVCVHQGNYGYASPDWSNPTAKWKFTPISRNGQWSKFAHGLGVGDLNSDGRLDVLYKDGWFEQPASLAGNPVWKQHEVFFARAGAQMHTYDVNGDGRTDVVTALAAHGFGLAWHEQLAGKDEKGGLRFKTHIFMNEQPHENRYGVVFSELHAVELVDIDGDGLKDIVTGKCFWAHGPAGSPDGDKPAVLYWFKLVRGAKGSVEWVPHRIDDNSGVGRQIGVADINGDRRPDLIIGNKKGAFVFRNEGKELSDVAAREAQPRPLATQERIVVRDRTLSPARPEAADMDAKRLSQIAADFRRETLEAKKYPFVSYLIARHGKIVAQESIGPANHGTGTPVQAKTLFPLASVTKAFTATAFMLLWDEGRVDLDDPVRAYLPAFPRAPPGVRTEPAVQMRMLHLLTHRAGFAGHFPSEGLPKGEWESRQDWTLASFVDRVIQQPLKFPPGTGHQYSSLNTDVLARVVEIVSGQEYAAFLRARILEPLGMKDTSYAPPAAEHSRIARTHRFEGGAWVAAGEALEFDHTFPHGGYGLYSTTGDLAIFMQMILNGGVYQGRQILSPRAVDRMLQMMSPVPPPGAPEYVHVRGASFEVGPHIRGIKPAELPATIATRPRQPDEPQRFLGHTGFGGMYIFADRDADLIGVFACKGTGRTDNTPAKDFILRALGAVKK